MILRAAVWNDEQNTSRRRIRVDPAAGRSLKLVDLEIA